MIPSPISRVIVPAMIRFGLLNLNGSGLIEEVGVGDSCCCTPSTQLEFPSLVFEILNDNLLFLSIPKNTV
jgi:hypothetical protein